MKFRRSKPQPVPAPAAEPAATVAAPAPLPHEPVMTPATDDTERTGRLRRVSADATIDIVRGESATDRLRNGRRLIAATD